MVLTQVLQLKAGAGAAAGATAAISYVPPIQNLLFSTGESACLVYRNVGWQCPVCGMTRGIDALMPGRLAAAFSLNRFSLVIVITIAGAFAVAFSPRFAEILRSIPSFVRRSAVNVTLVVFAMFSILRNIIPA